MDAVGTAARAIKAGEAALMIAGGVESMSRAPFVMPKAESAFSRANADLRHHHRLALHQQADEGAVRRRLDARDGRERGHRLQDRAATRRTAWRWPAQRSAVAAQKAGFFDAEIAPVSDRAEEGRPDRRQQGRASARDQPGGAGQAQGRGAARRHGDRRQRVSGVNDGACALLLAERSRRPPSTA